MELLSASQKKKLKALSHDMNPVVMIGKNGITDSIIKTINTELDNHEVIKIKFQKFKEDKKEIIEDFAAITGGNIIRIVGNIATIYRKSTKRDEHIL